MPAFPYIFASLAGTVPGSDLDANFALCAFASDVTALGAIVAALPSSTTPLIPLAGGAIGAASTLARADHQHPPQAGTTNFQTGTTYTVQSSDNGGIVDLSNASAITVTLPNSLPATFSCLFTQSGAGQVTFSIQAGGFLRQSSSLTKTRAQWSEVSAHIRANAGAVAEWVLSGDMA